MKIGIYNPFFDSLGGGERYTLALASHWSKTNAVFLFWDDASIGVQAQRRFNLDLSRVKTTPNIFKNSNLIHKVMASRQFDLIFFLSDGSIPTSLAKYNILHFQTPFPKVDANPLKLSRFRWVVCNSQFTRQHLDSRVAKRAIVIYPPVDTAAFSTARKRNKVILSVGRFTSYYQTKKQEVLIRALREAFKRKQLVGWRLILAGGLLPSDESCFIDLRKAAAGLPVTFLPNINLEKLTALYETATIYWHAAGYGQTRPELMEHFGITTAEAMAAGCVPLVFDAGGQREIVRPGVEGLLWTTTHELLEKTESLVHNPLRLAQLSQASRRRAADFDQIKFYKAFDRLLQQLER